MLEPLYSLGSHGGKLLLQACLDVLQVFNTLSSLGQLLLEFSNLCLQLAFIFFKFLTALGLAVQFLVNFLDVGLELET